MYKNKYEVRSWGDPSVGMSALTHQVTFETHYKFDEDTDFIVKDFLKELFDDGSKIDVLNDSDLEFEKLYFNDIEDEK